MAGIASPELADLTLSMMEYKYSLIHPHNLNKNLYRCVNDILLVNINNIFLKEICMELEIEAEKIR